MALSHRSRQHPADIPPALRRGRLKPKSTDDVAHLLERAAKAFRAGNLSRAESDAEKVLKSL